MTIEEPEGPELFSNKYCSLHELSEAELSYVEEMVGGYPWKMLILDYPDLPPWLETRAEDWNYIPLISFNDGECYFGYLFIIWDEARNEGIMCERGLDAVFKVADLTDLIPTDISQTAMEYIDSTWGFEWLLDDESVDVGRTDLLLKEVVRNYLADHVPSENWNTARNRHSPDEWIDQIYPKPEKRFKTGTVVITASAGHRAFRIVISGRTYNRISNGAVVQLIGRKNFFDFRQPEPFLWCFNETERGSLKIKSKKTTWLFSGNLDDERVLVEKY